MKLYRTKCTLKYGDVTEKFFSPVVNLFPQFKCDFDNESEFVNQAIFLFSLKHDIANIDDIEKEITYKVLKYHPVKDFFRRLYTWFVYKI